ncbi:hypothetical protein JTB14_035831 [Gonioctena quinquepunctata]|nr:hypothetical protein JTB14_035831 [Gonioctena quinquepunctata]
MWLGTSGASAARRMVNNFLQWTRIQPPWRSSEPRGLVRKRGLVEEQNNRGRGECRISDTLAATLTLPKVMAAALALREHIRIGLVRCKIEKRVNVPRCGKYWSCAHTSEKCTGPGRSSACFKCGVGDHKAPECKSSEHCLICNEMGPKIGATRCQAFKEALKDAKTSDRENRIRFTKAAPIIDPETPQ